MLEIRWIIVKISILNLLSFLSFFFSFRLDCLWHFCKKIFKTLLEIFYLAFYSIYTYSILILNHNPLEILQYFCSNFFSLQLYNPEKSLLELVLHFCSIYSRPFTRSSSGFLLEALLYCCSKSKWCYVSWFFRISARKTVGFLLEIMIDNCTKFYWITTRNRFCSKSSWTLFASCLKNSETFCDFLLKYFDFKFLRMC